MCRAATLRVSIASAFVVFLCGACARDDFPFELESSNRHTIGTTGVLPAGTRMQFKVSGLKPNETILLHRCGSPCNTAKLIEEWGYEIFSQTADDSVVLVESGDYYFWIRRKLDTGEVGPAFIERAERDDIWMVATYESGTTVAVAVDRAIERE